jgi:hypothetical protein
VEIAKSRVKKYHPYTRVSKRHANNKWFEAQKEFFATIVPFIKAAHSQLVPHLTEGQISTRGPQLQKCPVNFIELLEMSQVGKGGDPDRDSTVELTGRDISIETKERSS